jgi:adenosylcobinamide amidohydrolase
MFSEMTSRTEGGVELDVLVWRLGQPMLVASSAIAGGGLGPRHWIVNAKVPNDYGRLDGEQHVTELAAVLGLNGPGVGMLTAAHVRHHQRSSDGGVDVEVTVGLSHPTWAASDEEGEIVVTLPGTINIVAFLPVRLDDGALLNAVVSATEAKSQALWEASIPATGTPSDAVCVVCPIDGEPERFGGPRSLWGARLARSVHQAVLAGARQWAP